MFSLLSGAGLVGPSGVLGTVEVDSLMTGVQEAEGEHIEGVGAECPAAGLEKSCGRDVLLCRGSADVVVFMMELSFSGGLLDS